MAREFIARFLVGYTVSTALMVYEIALFIQNPVKYFSLHTHPKELLWLFILVFGYYVVFGAQYAGPVCDLLTAIAQNFIDTVRGEMTWRHLGRRIDLQLEHLEFRVRHIMHEQHPLRLFNELRGLVRALLV